MLAAVLLAATIQTAPSPADPRTAPPAPPPVCAAGTHRDEASDACVPDPVAVAPDQPPQAVTGDTTPPPPSADGQNNPLYKCCGKRPNPLAEKPGNRN